jgi:hypothetical protein
MTVIRLSLSGLTDDEADQALQALFERPRLERVLVDDDVGLLAKHGAVYQRLITSYRVHTLLCVVVGPRAESDGKLWLPEFLGGVQGYGVLWVGDPAGIDWRPAAIPVANRHVDAANGLEQLVDLLEADEVFDRLHTAFESDVHGKVASPGLRLAGADDEAATFTAALDVAIGRLCDPGSGPDGAFPALLPAAAGGARLDDNGPAARYRDEVMAAAAGAAKALEEMAGLRGRLRRGDGGLQGQLVELRAALADLRELVTRLLRDAHALGRPTDNQRRLILSAGIRFEAHVPGMSPAAAPAAGADRSPISRTISDAIKGGDTLALVARRLARTEREIRRHGSGSYLQEVDKVCPPGLLERIVQQNPRTSLRAVGAAEARKVLGIDDAKQSAQALVDLLIRVANREWSPAAADSGDLAGARIALDGISAALTEHAGHARDGASKARGARLARLGDALLPVLRDLVLRCVADEAATPSAGGQEAFQAAHDRAGTLLSEWLKQVQAHGVTATPPFATSGRYEIRPDIEDDVAEIREALLYPPGEEMWQLCGPGDIRVLDWRTSPQVVRFASRLNKEALAGTLPTGEIEWTTSGSYAGLLRLIPLQPRFVDSSGGGNSAPPASGMS